MPTITAIILTKDEEMHIERCIRSLKDFCQDIWVVDSFSTDRTVEIAQSMGAKTIQHEFKNQAQQFNWALGALDIRSEWIWRVDADEYVEKPLADKALTALDKAAGDVNGVYVNKKIIYLGKPLLHGGWYPAQQIKIIRKGFGMSENKPMDEHLIITSGKTISVDGDQTDENLHSLTWWTEKHNKYADREALNMLAMAYGMDDQEKEVHPKLFGNGAERKRWLKLKYARMPLYVRPFLNFFVRYVLQLGFIDGNHRWYVLQGFWYRYLVDAKIYELKKSLDFDDDKIKNYLRENYLT